MSELTRAERRAVIGKILRVASGNFLEMYDFVVYGYYAIYIAAKFFPEGNEYAALMMSLMTFGVGFIMRPLGALVLGAYVDRVGRRKGLLVTLLIMAVGTFAIAVAPGYATIGLFAPLIIVAARLLQGFSAGVELGGVSVYLSEISRPGHRGFYVSWQSASQQVAVVFTALVGIILTGWLTLQEMRDWGWRVPFIVGCLIIPVLLWLRNSLEETEAFKKSARPASLGETTSLVLQNWRPVLLGMMLSALNTTNFYLITAYTPTFAQRELQLGANGSLIVVLCVGLSNFMWVPIGGALSDRIGRRPMLVAMPIMALLTGYPLMSWLVETPDLMKLLVTQLWFSCVFGLYNGSMIPTLLEIMPARIRTAGFSLAFSLNTVVFGGFTPAIATWAIRTTGDRAAPAIWLSVAAAISLAAALLVTRRPVTEDATAAPPARVAPAGAAN